MKKVVIAVIAVILAIGCIACFTACNKGDQKVDDGAGVTMATKVNYDPDYSILNNVDLTGKTLNVGVIWVGDSTEGYTEAHIEGLNKAAANLRAKGATVNITTKEKIGEDATCQAQAEQLAQNNDLIISNSYGHQDHMKAAAANYPTKTFVAMTGDFASISGCSNLKNAFNDVYQSRFVSGVVAGYKLKQLVDDGLLTDKNYDGNNIKIGYVGAFPYAEVVSGYTAFYLGIKSIVPNVVMDVKYTQSWFDFDKEYQTAKSFISDGCIIIGQHADSEGAPTACEEAYMKGTRVYSVGYNVDMLSAAPHAALTSSTNDWSVYYTYCLTKAILGEEIAQNWAEGYNKGAVAITPINGTVFKTDISANVKAVVDGIHNGTIKVFDTNTFKVTVTESKNQGATVDENGKLLSYNAGLSYMDFSKNPPEAIYSWTADSQVIKNGEFVESDAANFRSAPYFDLHIDGITEK